MGARPLDDLTVRVLQAKRNRGLAAPPIDRHRLATAKERRRAEAELAQLISDMKAKNKAEEAALRGESMEESP